MAIAGIAKSVQLILRGDLRPVNYGMLLPPLYPIIDFTCFATKPDPIMAIVRYAEELITAGATLIQLRDKSVAESPRRFLTCAPELRRLTLGITKPRATLIINDRVDICLASGADGVHLGQDDLSPAAARRIFNQVIDGRNLLIGFSTHNLAQLRVADAFPIDYIAIGPVFATGSKANPDPVIGIEGVKQARQATRKPLVAIGGITRLNCREVKDAGADSVAVISDLLESPAKAVADFLRVLG
ncbi:MAG TPA: thiamine phosphate synthase [Candidatus Angelobacter sp.]|jgi:thiamine-phosphate pyrophosphorylase